MSKKPITKKQLKKMVIRKVPNARFIIHDEKDQSKIITYHWDDVVEIRFCIAGESKEKLIGTIDKAKRILNIKRIRSRHLFQKNMSYGFNYYILKNAKLFDTVHLKDDKDEWMIPVQFILDKGDFKHFKNSGNFELQKFVTLIDLTPYEYTPQI
jgi:hypothetical protein